MIYLDLSDYSAADIHEIVETYADMILRITFVRLKRLQDAEDITQEVFVRLMESKPALQTEDHLKAWLIRVALNLCKDHWKSAWIKRMVPLSDRLAVRSVDSPGIMDAVLQLPALSRQVIVLHYFIGYSIAEIASLTGHKPSAIATRLHRSRNKLKLEIQEELEGRRP